MKTFKEIDDELDVLKISIGECCKASDVTSLYARFNAVITDVFEYCTVRNPNKKKALLHKKLVRVVATYRYYDPILYARYAGTTDNALMYKQLDKMARALRGTYDNGNRERRIWKWN